MRFFKITAVTAGGGGHDHAWGDTYEVHADSQEEAEARVLALQPAEGTEPYARIVRTWERQVTQGGVPHWELLRNEDA